MNTRRRLLTIAAFASLFVACGDERPAGVSGESRTPPPQTGDPCSVPTPGCPCRDAGATATCTVKRVSGTYVSCSSGTMTCRTDGAWGICEGAAVEWLEDVGGD